MFEILDIPLEKAEWEDSLSDPASGGVVTFEGRVRDYNEGKTVTALSYESYSKLAQSEGGKILAEAQEKFQANHCLCRHRVGKLKVGEIAVKIVVFSGHRKAAFAACQYIIDQIKVRLPIWKKEFYQDGDSGWVHCSHDH